MFTLRNMKITWLILLLCSCYYCTGMAQVVGKTRIAGFSDQYKSKNTLGEYTFGYNEDHMSGGSFRRETSDRYGNKIGSYGLRIGDGRVRIVNYVADENGFRADVVSNEPGLESQDSNEFLKVTKKNIYKILVPGFRYASQAPHVTFETDQSSSSIHDDIQYDSKSPHVSLDSDQSSSTYTDGIKYTPQSPASAFETEQSTSSFLDDDNDEVGLEYDYKDSNMDNMGNVFLNQDGDIGENYSNVEDSQINDDGHAKAFSEDGDGLENFYNNEESFDDGYDDEYRRASESVSRNDTFQWQAKKESDGVATNIDEAISESSVESSNSFLTFLQKDDVENAHQNESSGSVREDLQVRQSEISTVKSSEHATLQDAINSTVTVMHKYNETQEVQNTTDKA